MNIKSELSELHIYEDDISNEKEITNADVKSILLLKLLKEIRSIKSMVTFFFYLAWASIGGFLIYLFVLLCKLYK